MFFFIILNFFSFFLKKNKLFLECSHHKRNFHHSKIVSPLPLLELVRKSAIYQIEFIFDQLVSIILNLTYLLNLFNSPTSLNRLATKRMMPSYVRSITHVKLARSSLNVTGMRMGHVSPSPILLWMISG